MKELLEKEGLLTRYLFGDASEAECEEIAQQFFTDDELFEQLIVVENDLIDRYVRGELSQDEENHFKQSYLTTQPRFDKILTAKALIQTATESRTAKKNLDETKKKEELSWLAWFQQPVGGFAWGKGVLAALVLFLVLISSFLLWNYNNKNSNEIVKIPPTPSPTPSTSPTPDGKSSPSPSNEENKNTPEKKTPDAEPKPMVATLLISGSSRDGGATPTAVINENTSAVRLQIKIKDSSYSSYSVTVKRVSGAEISSQENIKSAKGLVTTTISAQKLSQGDYFVTVEGRTNDGTKVIVKEGYFKVKISK